MNILEEIFAHKQVEIRERQKRITLAEMQHAATQAAPALDFVSVLRNRPSRWPALIAEIKRASPSRGLLIKDFDPLRLAHLYQANGASAASILTDERFFQGSLEYLRQVRQAHPDLPLLRKDFLCDPYQVYEARAAGADAVLLIAASLDPTQLCDLRKLANELGMAALVEVHDRGELDLALGCSASLVGINNRDLRDFTVRLETGLDLRPHVPSGVCLVAESGIHTSQDVQRLAEAGFDAILVGEALVTAPDPGARVRSLAYPLPERSQEHEN